MKKFIKFFREPRVYLGLIVLVALLAAGVYFYFRFGTPVLFVNGTPVTTTRFLKNANGASLYLATAQKVYMKDESKKADPSEVRAQVLTQLIEAELIHDEVEKEVGKEREYLIESKLGPYRDNAELRTAAQKLYGMSFNDFWAEVLVPQAERDILAGRLFLQGKNIDEWLTSSKRDASVHFVSSGYSWNGAYVSAAN